MRKTKEIKSKYQEKVDWFKSDQVQIMIAGTEILLDCSEDYFNKQDTAFDEEYLKTIRWAFDYFLKFNSKLKEKRKIEAYIYKLSKEKYLLMLSEISKFEPNKLGFNLESDREKDDNIYYTLISKSIMIFESLLKTTKQTKENEWIFRYFKMVKIQMRSLCKIFEEEMKSI